MNNDGWIPVEERLPEEGMEVIVTDKEGRVWGTLIYGYPDETDTEMCFYEWDDEDWQCFKPDVIAWRPLPEPYRPDRKGVITMTEKEAISRIKDHMKIYRLKESRAIHITVALSMAIAALKEIQQYREIGTVKECREAVEKQKVKKPEVID